jgi:hypothetical protein
MHEKVILPYVLRTTNSHPFAHGTPTVTKQSRLLSQQAEKRQLLRAPKNMEHTTSCSDLKGNRLRNSQHPRQPLPTLRTEYPPKACGVQVLSHIWKQHAYRLHPDEAKNNQADALQFVKQHI